MLPISSFLLQFMPGQLHKYIIPSKLILKIVYLNTVYLVILTYHFEIVVKITFFKMARRQIFFALNDNLRILLFLTPFSYFWNSFEGILVLMYGHRYKYSTWEKCWYIHTCMKKGFVEIIQMWTLSEFKQKVE